MVDALLRERAVEATSLFLLGEFESALQTLQRAEESADGDQKVWRKCIV
jgi:hypothetical protein